MSEQSRLKWTRGLVGFSLPLVLGIGFVVLIVIGVTTTMMG